MNLRKSLSKILPGFALLVVPTSCIVCLGISQSTPMSSVLLMGIALMFVGTSCSLYFQSINQSIKKRDIFLAASVLGVGLLLWGAFITNVPLLLVSYPFFIFPLVIYVIRFMQGSLPSHQALHPSNKQDTPPSRSIREAFSTYERGYQPHELPPTPVSQEETQKLEASLEWDKYEQPLITYPEMPPM